MSNQIRDLISTGNFWSKKYKSVTELKDIFIEEIVSKGYMIQNHRIIYVGRDL